MKKFRCANKGFILSSLKARNLMWKSFLKNGRRPEMITMLLDFGSCFARNLGGNLLKEWPGARNDHNAV